MQLLNAVVAATTLLSVTSAVALPAAQSSTAAAAQPATATTCAIAPGKYADNDTRLRTLWSNFANAVMYPNNLKQVKAINSTLLAKDVQGRVDVTNTFDGQELNTAYLFGLYGNIATSGQNKSIDPSPLQDYPLSWEQRAFMSKGDMVFGTVNFQQYNPATNMTLPTLVDVYLLFDKCDVIKQYDVRFQRSSWYSDVVAAEYVPTVAQKLNIKPEAVTPQNINDVVAAGAIKIVCPTVMDVCKGKNQQYKDINECNTFLNTLPVGQAYELGQNTISCRLMHSNMVRLRPDVHCPHLGKTGGGMCIQRDYTQVTNDKYFKTPFVL